MNIRKQYGFLNRAYIEQVKDNYLVYAFSSKYKRNVNVSMFSSKKAAILSKEAINGHQN
jgi:hypothetical protein